jgi:hypothetical protein
VRVDVLRVVPAVVVALFLGACSRDPYVGPIAGTWSGKWRVARQIDRITGRPIAAAVLATRNSSNSAERFTLPATLELGCFRGQPIVRFAFAFKIGTNRDAEFAYRFDDKPGHVAPARITPDHRFLLIEKDAAVAQFVSELSSSKVLYLHVRTLNAGRSSAEFELEGAPVAIQSALAGCPATPAATPPRTAFLAGQPSAH